MVGFTNDDDDGPSIFRDHLGRRFHNSPDGVAKVSERLDEFVDVIRGSLLLDLTRAMEAAEKATSILFCVYLITKQENMETGFRSEVDQARGRTFGHRLINWVIGKADIDIADNLKMVWSGVHQSMGGAIEMMIRNLEPALAPGAMPSPKWVQGWIKDQGGLKKLHWTWMNARQSEVADEKSRAETLKKIGLQAVQLQEANKAGFDTIESYNEHRAKTAEKKKQDALHDKIEELKRRLVKDGTRVEGTPPADKLFITAADGSLHLLSDDDEFSLLHCGASTIV